MKCEINTYKRVNQNNSYEIINVLLMPANKNAFFIIEYCIFGYTKQHKFLNYIVYILDVSEYKKAEAELYKVNIYIVCIMVRFFHYFIFNIYFLFYFLYILKFIIINNI